MSSRLRRLLAAAAIVFTGFAGIAQATVIGHEARAADTSASVSVNTSTGQVRGSVHSADTGQAIRVVTPSPGAIDGLDLGGDKPPLPPIGPGVHCGVIENPLCIVGLDLGGVTPPLPPIGPGVHCGVTENPLCIVGLDLGGVTPPLPPIGPGVHCELVDNPACWDIAGRDRAIVNNVIARAMEQLPARDAAPLGR